MGTAVQVQSDGTATRMTIPDAATAIGTAAANAIPKAGAGGTLAIGWIPTGATSSTVTIGNDARLSDARTPTAHAATHKSAGADAIILDELKVPTVDVTTLDATTSVHGLLPKLGGGTTNFFRADGTWAAPPGGSGEVNTASNVGVGGVGIFKQKTIFDLELKNINAGSTKITVTNDAANSEVDIDADANVIVAASNDARLSDARTPTAHTASHRSGGTDPVQVNPNGRAFW